MAVTKTRIKSVAQSHAVQSDDDCAATIRMVGDTQREALRLQAAMNDEIGAITERYQAQLAPLSERLKLLQAGVQTWAEANRERLTGGGKIKSYNYVTGTILWRQRPPSVRVTGAESVIETLKRMGLGQLVRVKEEINKEAILNEPDAVRGIAGVSVTTGLEDFVIEPFEQDASAA